MRWSLETAVGRVVRSCLVYGEPGFGRAVDFIQCWDAHPTPGIALALLRHPRLCRGAISIAALPTVTVELSHQNAAIWSAPNFPPATRGLASGRVAQAVLDLQSDDDLYFTGRRKKTLRNHLNQARRAGITVTRSVGYSDWLASARQIYQQRPGGEETLRRICQPDDDEKMVYLVATNPTGTPVAIAGAVVLDQLAVLFTLITRPGEPYAALSRYLIHTELRSQLKKDGVQFLTAGSALRLVPGLQYFQFVLGYEVRNLRIRSSP
jgi:hypothetical protein